MLELEELGRQAVSMPPVRTPERGEIERRVARRGARRQRRTLGASCVVVAVAVLGVGLVFSDRPGIDDVVVTDSPIVPEIVEGGAVYVPSEQAGLSAEGAADELGRVMFGWETVQTSTSSDSSPTTAQIVKTETGVEVSAVMRRGESGSWAVDQIGSPLSLEPLPDAGWFARLDVPAEANGLGRDGVEFIVQTSGGAGSSIEVREDEEGPVLQIVGPSREEIDGVLLLYRDAAGGVVGAQATTWSSDADPFIAETVPDALGLPLTSAIDLIEGSGHLVDVRIQDSPAIEKRRSEIRADGATDSRTIEAELFADLTDEGLISMDSVVVAQRPIGGQQIYGLGQGSMSGGRVVLIVETGR